MDTPFAEHPLLALSPLNNHLVAAGDRGIGLFEIDFGELGQALGHAPQELSAIALSPEGQTLVTTHEMESRGRVTRSKQELLDVNQAYAQRRINVLGRPGGHLDWFGPILGDVAFAPGGDAWVASTSSLSLVFRQVGVREAERPWAFVGSLGPSLMLEETSFTQASSGASFDVRDDLAAGNGRAARLPGDGKVSAIFNAGQLKFPHGFVGYAVVRLEGRPTAGDVIEYYVDVNGKRTGAKTLEAGRFGDGGYQLVHLGLRSPAELHELREIAWVIQSAGHPSVSAVWIDSIIIVPVAHEYSPKTDTADAVPAIMPEIEYLSYVPNGERLWGIEDELDAIAWQTADGSEAVRKRLISRVLEGDDILYALSAGDQRVIVGSRRGDVFCLAAKDGSQETRFGGPGGAIRAVALHPQERRAVVGTSQGLLRMYEVPGGKVIADLPSHAHSVESVVFSRDGEWLVSGSKDRSIKVWRCQGDKIAELFTLEALPGPVKTVRLSANKARLAVLIDGERAARVWNLDLLRSRLRALDPSLAW